MTLDGIFPFYTWYSPASLADAIAHCVEFWNFGTVQREDYTLQNLVLS
jgi:hypothetical protein